MFREMYFCKTSHSFQTPYFLNFISHDCFVSVFQAVVPKLNPCHCFKIKIHFYSLNLSKSSKISFNLMLIPLILKPMLGHAVARPLSLTDPAPVEAAASSRANHVHAATRAFSGRSTLWTRLCGDFDGNFRGFVPSSVGNPRWIDGIFARPQAIDGWSVRKALADVESLSAIFAEHEL